MIFQPLKLLVNDQARQSVTKLVLVLVVLVSFALHVHQVQSSESAVISTPSLDSRPLALTKAEQAWLDSLPTIRVGIMQGWEPISFLAEDSSSSKKLPAGISLDYLNAINRKLGNSMHIVPVTGV